MYYEKYVLRLDAEVRVLPKQEPLATYEWRSTMTKEEIALQLTLKALDCGMIRTGKFAVDYEPKENDPLNTGNMKTICQAYKTALAALESE